LHEVMSIVIVKFNQKLIVFPFVLPASISNEISDKRNAVNIVNINPIFL